MFECDNFQCATGKRASRFVKCWIYILFMEEWKYIEAFCIWHNEVEWLLVESYCLWPFAPLTILSVSLFYHKFPSYFMNNFTCPFKFQVFEKVFFFHVKFLQVLKNNSGMVEGKGILNNLYEKTNGKTLRKVKVSVKVNFTNEKFL